MTGGAISDLAKLARDFGGALTPAWKPLVELTGEHLTAFQASRRLKLATSLQEQLVLRGITKPTRDIAPSFLIPLIAAASLESDDDLHNVWATMLANAADASSELEMRTAYISMLSQMSHFDVSILASLARMSEAHPETAHLVCSKLPGAVGLGTETSTVQLPPHIEISLANLGSGLIF